MLFLALCLASIASSHDHKSPASYLDKPARGESNFKAYDWIRKQLDDQKLTSSEQVREFLIRTEDSLSDDAKPPADYSGHKFLLEDVLYELIQLSDVESTCTNNMIGYFINIVEHTYGSLDVLSQPGSPNHDSGLLNYLQHYGKTKFSSCLKNQADVNQMSIDQVDPEVERIFDGLISSQDKQRGRMLKDDDLLKLAKEVDLNEGKLDAKRMLKVAKEYENGESYKSTASTKLLGFIADKCSKLLSTVKNFLNIYNLDRLLSPTGVQAATSSRLLKLNEYSRICQYRFEEAEANIKKSMSNKLIQRAKGLVHRV